MISVTRQERYGHLSRSSFSEFHLTEFYLIQQKYCQTWLGTKAGRVTGTRKEIFFPSYEIFTSWLAENSQTLFDSQRAVLYIFL